MCQFFKRLQGTRITATDYVMVAVRVGFLICCLPIGFSGVVIALLLMYLFDKAIQYWYKVTPIGVVEKNVWYDSVRNRCYIMATAILERADEDSLKAVFRDRLQKLDKRFRSKMVKILDNYYFKEMSGEELQQKLAKAYHVIDRMESMDEVEELMSREQNKSIEEGNLQYEVWLVPEFGKSGQESLMVLKIHHVMGDGLGILIAMSGLQEHYSKE